MVGKEMNYVTKQQANKSVTQRTRRRMAVEVAPAVGFLGHHSSWSKRDCQSGLGKAAPQSKMPGSGELFKGKNKYGLCFAAKALFLIGWSGAAIRRNRR
jgi:hypothetical protein